MTKKDIISPYNPVAVEAHGMMLEIARDEQKMFVLRVIEGAKRPKNEDLIKQMDEYLVAQNKLLTDVASLIGEVEKIPTIERRIFPVVVSKMFPKSRA